MEAKNETKFSEISDTLKSFISELQGEMLITQDEVIRIKKSIREDNTDELESAISDLSKKLNNVKSDPVQQVPSEITVKIDDKTLSKMKGEKGDKGDKGDSIKGKDGYTPIKGVDYFDGKNGSPDTGEQIVEKINTLENVIDIKTIKDFPIIEGTADIKRQMDTIGNQVLRLLSRPKTTGGGGGTWGSITGTLSDQTDLQSAIDNSVSTETENAQSGTSYTFALTDGGKMVTGSNSSPTTFTVPTNSSIGFPIGTRIDVLQIGTGKITIANSVGVILLSQGGNKTIKEQYVACTLWKKDTDLWYLMGNLQA